MSRCLFVLQTRSIWSDLEVISNHLSPLRKNVLLLLLLLRTNKTQKSILILINRFHYIVGEMHLGSWPKIMFTLQLKRVSREGSSVTRKNRQMSIKVTQNDFTRKMIVFDTFTKIASECRRFGQIICWQRL